MKNNLKAFIKGFIALNLIWYIASLIVNMKVLPSPFKIYSDIIPIAVSKLYIHAAYSLFRIFSGIAISLLIGISIGILMAYFKRVDALLSPLVYFTYPIPKISLLPVIMLTFGLKEKSKIIMIVLIIVFQIIISTRDSIRNIPKETYYPLKCLGATKFQIFKEVTIPYTLSEILTSIRIALGTAISVLFFTETYGTRYGLGYFIMDAWTRIDYIEMYCGIVLLSLIGFILFIILDYLEIKLCKWKNNGR